MQTITLFNKATGLFVAKSEKSGLLGVVNSDMDIIIPFSYTYIDNVMSANGVIMAKKLDKKILIEINN